MTVNNVSENQLQKRPRKSAAAFVVERLVVYSIFGLVLYPRLAVPNIDLLHVDLTDRVIGEFYDVFNALGHGFVESVYEEAMVIALRAAGLRVDRQVRVTVYFRGRAIGTFKADLIVEASVVLELKASRAIDRAHEAPLLNYLRATNLEVGLILNFGDRPRFKRFVFANDRKIATVPP